jgi:LmbE family N-acetylglucosaminyl deacetylase
MSILSALFRRGSPAFGGGYDSDVSKLPPLGHDGPKTLMAIMAHPDDIDFGSAGSIAKWCAEGWTVYYVLATSGDKGTHDPAFTPQELAATREEEQRQAARVLGVREVFFLGYPDGFLEPTHELREQLVRLFRTHHPDVVLTWDGFRPSFNHNDHRNIGIAVRDALFPATRDRLYFPQHDAEGLGEWRVNEILLVGSPDPNYFVDVSAFIEKKADAILAHASQVQSHDRDELIKQMRSRGRRPGGRGLVESFKRVQMRSSQRAQRAEEAAKQGQDAASTPDTTPAPGALDVPEGTREPAETHR